MLKGSVVQRNFYYRDVFFFILYEAEKSQVLTIKSLDNQIKN